jgi:hypothetical protein
MIVGVDPNARSSIGFGMGGGDRPEPPQGGAGGPPPNGAGDPPGGGGPTGTADRSTMTPAVRE